MNNNDAFSQKPTMPLRPTPVVINNVVRQKAKALSAGISLVRQIIKEHQFPHGFTTKQMYELAQTYPPPPDFEGMKAIPQHPVPRPDHPVRSITFLKNMILPALDGQQEIKTVSQARSDEHPEPDLSNLRPVKRQQRVTIAKQFVWKVIPPEERSVPKVPVEKKVVGAEVGVGADISHLNKRRQRARTKKVTEAVLKLKGHLQFSKELDEIATTRN